MAFESLTDRLNGVFKKLRGKGKLTEADIKAAMREVRMALLEADVNYKVAKDFCAQVSERAMGQEVMESLTPAQQVVKIVNEELTKLMGGDEPQYLRIKNKGQTVLMMCGLQGNGKTTHAAKLGRYYRSQGRRPLLVACDVYRPAAIEQLKIVGEQVNVPVFTMGTEKPELIAEKAMAYARDHGNDIVILDTAGRLQIDDALMDELVRIKQHVEVDETLLVVDAMSGQEAVNVAKTFNEKIGITGVILTKTDGDTRGGAGFEFVQIFVISNGTLTKYYSNTTRDAHIKQQTNTKNKGKKQTSNSFEFTSYWAIRNNEPIYDLVDFTQTFLSKHTLLNVLTKYCVFTSEELLLVMRPYQIAATEAILQKIKTSSNYKEWGKREGGGYIWHTTGSGKTLTSFKTARLASHMPEIDKVLFVVDRKDLDYQTMKEYDRLRRVQRNSNTSTAVLTRQLGDENARIIITTIQKLTNSSQEMRSIRFIISTLC